MGFRNIFENKSKSLLVVLFLFSSLCSFAQLSDLHYLPPLKQDANNRAVERQAVYLSTPETTAFTVRAYRGTSLTPVATFSVSNASPVTYTLANGDNNITMVANANTGIVLTNAGLRFESDNNELFYVNYRSSSSSQAASLTSKGRQALGQNFKWGGVPNRSASADLTTSLGIMASEDNTTVTISGYDPDCVFRLQNNASGIVANSIAVNLNRGESYVLEAKTTAATANIEGWLGASIRSDRDIAISHGGLNYGFAVPGSRDSGIDQPVPENRIGKEYIFIRGNGIDLTETPIIIATQNNTDVFVNGATTPIATLNDGDYIQIPGSNYSSSTPGANMLVTTSKDAYAYQNLAGAAGEQTIGLNFVAPVNCLLADNLNNIPNITDAAGISVNGGITIIASTSTPNANIVVNDGTGAVALPAPNFVTGSTLWKTFFIPNLVGDVSVQSTGPIAVGFFGVNDDRGIAGYFSGFDTVPEVDLQLTGAGCIPGGDLEVADPNFDAYQWYDNDGIAITGATSSIYTPTVAGDYFVRVTKGGCTYDSQPLSAYYCDPDIKLTKTADVAGALEGDTVNFRVTVESLGVDPVTNLVVTELADGFTIVSASPSTGNWSDPDWTIGTINAGDLETIDIVATVDELPNNSPSLIRTNTVVNAQDQVDHDITTDQPSADIDVDNDSDLDGVVDNDDLDDDNDGIPDLDEGDFDSDGDGLNNRIDLDSDNDGMYDLEEAGHLQPGTYGTVNGSVGTNGLPDLVETSPDSGTVDYVLAESTDDTDTISHFLDLDSDGDGIPDNVEAQSTLGYISPNADDAATYATNRGVNSAYLGGLTPENTDTDDTPDYLDIDSDNEGANDVTEAGLILTGNDSDNDGLDDVTDISTDYSIPDGIIGSPISGGIRLPDTDEDALTGGDVDFRDAADNRPDTDGDGISDVVDLDDDNDGIPDEMECSLSPLRTGPVAMSDVTFDISGTGGTASGVLNSISITGVGNLLDYFVKPIGYTSSFSSNDPNDINEQYHAMRLSDITSPSWNTDIRLAFQSQDLNHYQALDNTIIATDTWTLTYDAVQVSTEGFLVLMERAGNNPYAINVYDAAGNLVNASPYIVTTTAYVDTPVDASNGQNIKLAIIPMTDLAPIGSLVGAVEFFAHNVTGDGPDGKAFITTDGDICNDTDGDGIINSLDLDSDNDGIYDVVESGVLNESGADDGDNDGRLDGNPSDFGNNGLLNAIENNDSLGATIDYTLSESPDDVDAIANFMDLDSDGDGIPDNVEAQITVGYTAPSGTVDANGADTAYPSGIDPTNTDGTDSPDYLDLDSDNEGHNDTTEAGIALSGTDNDNDGLDDGLDGDTMSYNDPGGTIDDPLTAPMQLLDSDNDAAFGGDVDFRDASDDRPDNDNDGIVDALDFDDDNDGILDTEEGCGNFIINGSFEQDDFTDASTYPNGFTGANGTFIGTTYNTNILTAWNYTQNMDGWVEGGAFGPAPFADAYQGTQYLDIIGNNNVTGGVSNILSQTANLTQGQNYVLTFFWGEDIGHQAGDLVTLEMDVIDADGAAIFDETFTTVAIGNASGTSGPKSWFYIERTFTATTNDITVRFSSVPDAPKTSVGAALDDVVLVHSVTSDCWDTDNDGIPDAMDLDSDNDGIYDAVEAGHDAAHTNGILNGNVGADGIPDSVQNDPNRERVNYIPLDSDGDTESDVRELDSDGDACFDVAEAGFVDGDADYVLGNSPVTVDANGLVTAAIDGYTLPLDADGNGVLDYREAGRTPMIDTQPSDITVCSDRSISFSLAATDADTYQWQLFDGSNWNDLTDSGIYSGTDSDTLQIVNATLAENENRYRAVVSNTALACGIVNSGEVTLTVAETPNITIGDAQQTEGGTIRFPVTLSSLSCLAEDISLTFTFTDGSADSSDYTNTNVQITIPAGSLTGEVAVQTTPDEIDEADETFTISIASIDAGTVNDSSDTATGTILDDDITELDSDDDGILDSFEDLNLDGDNDPATDPTNSDGDLYPDYLDIDSDNDGIPDNVEAQTTLGYIPPSLQDMNANGLDDAYEVGVRRGLIPVNTDGEDFPDFLDADSDNDGVPDAIEGHDANHDGIADVRFVRSDKDDDGLDDGYEGAVQIDADVNDEIDDPANDLPDTDGDGNLDYRDIDDDNDDTPTLGEDANSDGNYANDDVDGNGIPDYLEANYPDVEVFNVVTPNGDTVHDYLMISGLDIRPNNSLKIFNRWGVVVYETDAYDTQGNRFDGTSRSRATYGKEEKLPAGTYFYMLNYEDLERGFKTLSGHLYLN